MKEAGGMTSLLDGKIPLMKMAQCQQK